jgi:hypothetical protein
MNERITARPDHRGGPFSSGPITLAHKSGNSLDSDAFFGLPDGSMRGA